MSLAELFEQRLVFNVAYAEGENYVCCLIDAHMGIPHIVWMDKPQTNQQLLEYAQMVSDNYRIIRPIPHQAIWRKVIYVPKHFTPAQIGVKALATIQENLPIGLKEVFCDYETEYVPQKKAYKVSLFATRRDTAAKYAVTPDTVLDCELHCFFRGYHALNREADIDNPNNRYYCRGVEFQITRDGFEITPKAQPSEGCFTVEDIVFPEDFEVREKEAFVLAFGAMLWTDPQ